MGYRGEDASRTRADSRRQPWQSSSGAGPGASGPWDDGSLGYGQDDYAAVGGYNGYAADSSHAGYDDYAQGNGHAAPGGYAAPEGYGATDGYGQHGTCAYPDASVYADSNGYANGNGYHDASGYANGDGYRNDTGYVSGDGNANGSSYQHGAGYQDEPEYGDGYGSGYAADGGYAAGDGYADNGGYADDGYGSGYGQPAGHGQQGGYDGYRDMPGDRGYGSGPYQQQQADQDQLAGRYPANGYGRPGGYPALGPGSGEPSAGGYANAGNDWYNAQPGAASGSGFADTGTIDARAVGSYGAVHDPVRGFPPPPTGPRRQLTAAPQDLVAPDQQERYDEVQYDAYADYDQGDYDDAQGYSPAGGYQATRGYDDYDEPGSFDTRGYDDDLDYGTGSALGLAPGYDEDPYRERYGDRGTGPRPGPIAPGPRGGRGKKGKSGKKKNAGKRVRVLLLSVAMVVVVGIVGVAVYTFILKPKSAGNNSALSTGPLPSTGTSSAATSACVKQLGAYCHIELRTDDPVPLTLTELFPPAFENEADHMSFTRLTGKLDKTCSNAVNGHDLISALQSAKCTQVLRASYVNSDNTIIGTIGVANLATTNQAHHAGKLVGANDFIDPLSTSKGIGSKLRSGTGVVQAEYKGHYLILIWAEFATGKAPKTPAQDRELQQFEGDLVAGTANPALSERMVNGSPTAAASG